MRKPRVIKMAACSRGPGVGTILRTAVSRTRYHREISGPARTTPITSLPTLPPCRFTSAQSLASPLAEASLPQADQAWSSWRVVAGVCVQRMPSLGRERTALELEYREMSDQIKMEKSKLSDFELEELSFECMKKARLKKAQEDATDLKSVSGGDKFDEFEDMKELRELELQEFKPGSQLTEADLSGDKTSLNRKLDRVLYLLVKKPRQEHAWQMPQGGVEADESLLQAAKRELAEECGAEMKASFYGQAPVAVLSYHHPPLPSSQTKSKVFFLKAFHQGGVLKLDGKEVVDHVWVTREEMSEFVSEEYYKAVKPILME